MMVDVEALEPIRFRYGGCVVSLETGQHTCLPEPFARRLAAKAPDKVRVVRQTADIGPPLYWRGMEGTVREGTVKDRAAVYPVYLDVPFHLFPTRAR